MKKPIATTLNDEILAPGEPLRLHIDPKNQALIQDDVQRRVEMARARLTKREYWSLSREADRLRARLERADYERLHAKHKQMRAEYQQMVAAYKVAPSREIKKHAVKLRSEIKRLSQRIDRLAPHYRRYRQVKTRLDAHERVIQLEKEDAENKAAFFREADTWLAQIKAVFRQSKRLHYVTTDRNNKPVTVIPVIDHVFLKSDKVYFRVQTMRQGLLDRLTGMWHSALPYGVDVSDLICDETIENLTASCGRVVTVERGQRSQDIFYVISRLDSADGIPKLVLFEKILGYYPQDKHKNTPWGAGIGPNREIVHFDFEKYPHVLVAGASGGGKSNLINAILSQLITMNSPDELRLVLIDNKGGVELSHFDGVQHLLLPTVISASGVVGALATVRKLMQARYAAMYHAGAKSLTAYNAKITEPVPRIIIVIDEMATLLGIDDTPDIQTELRVLTSQGRAAGVHIIIATQHPSVDVLPGWIKTNLTLRIASRMPNHTASQIVVDSISAAHLPEIPGRMVFRRGGFEQMLQTPFIDDAAIARAVGIANEYPAARWQVSQDGEAIEVSEPAPRPVFGEDEYIRLALTIDGSLSPRYVHEAGAAEFISRSEAETIYKRIVERLQVDRRIEIEGVTYKLQRVGRGHRLEVVPDEVPEETPDDNPQTEAESQEEAVTT